MPPSPGYQFVSQEYASLKPRNGLGPRGLRRCRHIEHKTAKGKHAPAEILSVAEKPRANAILRGNKVVE
eukprot:5956788-Lingulodinium_polyedra.AAC.1